MSEVLTTSEIGQMILPCSESHYRQRRVQLLLRAKSGTQCQVAFARQGSDVQTALVFLCTDLASDRLGMMLVGYTLRFLFPSFCPPSCLRAGCCWSVFDTLQDLVITFWCMSITCLLCLLLLAMMQYQTHTHTQIHIYTHSTGKGACSFSCGSSLVLSIRWQVCVRAVTF